MRIMPSFPFNAADEAAAVSPLKIGLRTGFTLIELAIVLVIIGLIVGGVLVGRDLVKAAEVRATVTQAEKFSTAVNTFREKYGYLPGDIKDPDASSFGLQPRGQYAGQGDGNGVLEGVNANMAGRNIGYVQGAGETVMLWADLSAAHLIEGSFSTASPTTPPGSTISGTALNNYFPGARVGNGNYFYAYSTTGTSNTSVGGVNYFGLSAITSIPPTVCNYCIASSPGLTVSQAAAIDKKVDDGLPQSGNVTAYYLNYVTNVNNAVWAAGGGLIGAVGTALAHGTTTTCYDNGGNAGTIQQYSVEISNGSYVNCAVSFRFQ